MSKIKMSMALAFVAALSIPSHYFCSQTEQQDKDSTASTSNQPTSENKVERGKYLVMVGGCTHCHSPKIMSQTGPVSDTSRFLSGHPAGSALPAITYDATKPGNWMLFAPGLTALIGPWGISYSANLTPDSTTGIGTWTADIFKKALKTGKHLGDANGRPILPPMPWQDLGMMTDEDLDALFAYLQSLPPIKNQVPMPTPPMDVKISK